MATVSHYFVKTTAKDASAAKGGIIDLTATGNANTSNDSKASMDKVSLTERWRHLYAEELPKAARERAPAQKKWPVTLDHCFARIVLDNSVGVVRPWTEVVKSPAIKHMTEHQFRAAIAMGEEILSGKADLVELDERSLALRGKQSKADKAKGIKRKRKVETTDSDTDTASKKPKAEDTVDEDGTKLDDEKEDLEELKALIDTSDKTEFQKLCLKALLQIPSGRFSTYGAMAKYLESSPRAVGNAMRGNPFAPRVPCHRILAADRSIGGFGGDWGVNGKHVNEKFQLLRSEGVKFDSKGKVLGPIFEGYRS